MKMMKKTGVMVLAAAIAAPAMMLSTTATADVNPWQDCGLGAMVFPDNGTASAISNVVWDLGTTALTSAYSSVDQCQGTNVAAAAFIDAGYAYLEEDTVVGGGEYASTLMNIYGCDATSHDALVASVQSGFAEQLASASYSDMSHEDKAYGYFELVNGAVSQSTCAAS